MDSAAIEQMNKLRKSLGLPLLGGAQADPENSQNGGLKFKEKSTGDDHDDSDGEPASTLETREAAGYANYQQVQDEEKRRREREQRKKTLQKAREKAARLQRLEGVGLGDADENYDTKSWLKGQSKRQKEIEKERARKLEEELAERERLAAIDYTSADLAGVQVAHEMDDFDETAGDQILTLKDQEIGKDDDEDDEGDILENAELLAKDRLKEKLDAKKKISYDIHDNEKKALLSQYDEKKRKAFTLDAKGSSVEEREAKRQAVGEKLKNTISLDTILKPEPVSDYQEIKIKKPKKSNKKSKRQREIDQDDEIFASSANGTGDIMEVDAPKPKSKAESTFNDDEDLSNALMFSRRAALKKKKVKAEDLVRQLKAESEDPEAVENDGGIVLDDTTAFLDNLRARPDDEDNKRPIQSIEQPSHAQTETGNHETHNDEDEHMDDAEIERDHQPVADVIKREGSATPTVEVSRTGLDEEQALNQGIGAALNLLKSRGIVQDSNAGDKNALYRDRQRFIQEQRMREHDAEQRARAQRERDRLTGKNNNLSQKEREERARWQNEARSQQQSIAAAAAFNREYKPDVELRYFDDKGRQLNQKEAFKNLSHQFHGKGSGKGKTEKHLKKLDEEKRNMAKSVLDSTSDDRGMQRAQGTMGKRDKVAGVRLA